MDAPTAISTPPPPAIGTANASATTLLPPVIRTPLRTTSPPPTKIVCTLSSLFVLVVAVTLCPVGKVVRRSSPAVSPLIVISAMPSPSISPLRVTSDQNSNVSLRRIRPPDAKASPGLLANTNVSASGVALAKSKASRSDSPSPSNVSAAKSRSPETVISSPMSSAEFTRKIAITSFFHIRVGVA